MVKSKEGGASASWDRDLTIHFCEVCLKEVELGNRPTTHFNKEGWENVVIKFEERTGKEYNRTQLKNKWDQLKKDWKLWKDLKRGATGLGWNSTKKTIDASADWWKEKLEVMPNARKFRYSGIDPDLEDKLDMIFAGVVATGCHAMNPSRAGTQNSEPEMSNDLIEETLPTIDELVESSHTKRHPTLGPTRLKKKKGGAGFLRTQISQLVTACTNISTEGNTSHGIPSLSEAIKVLDSSADIFEDIPLYLFATKLLEDTNKREIFLTMVPERRVHYLRYYLENTTS